MVKNNVAKKRIGMISDATSLKDAFSEFMIHCETKRLSEKTTKTYKENFKRLIDFCGEDMDVTDIDTGFIRKFNLHLQNKYTKIPTINNVLRHVRAMVRFWEDENMIPTRVKIPLLKEPDIIKDGYTEEELSKLMVKPKTRGGSFTEYRNWVIICMFCDTGIRAGSLLGLQVKNIDFDNGFMIVQGDNMKNKKASIITLSTRVLGILKEYIKFRQPESGDDILFCSDTGKKLTVNGLSQALNEYNNVRGVDKQGLHLFRHTYASNFILEGGDAFDLQRRLNHKTLDMTRRYVNEFSGKRKNLDQFSLTEKIQSTQTVSKMKMPK